MDYAEAHDFLYSLPSWLRDRAYHPGLTRVRELLAILGDPHQQYPVIHVAGTNGKGSVCAMAAAMISAAGHRVGLHTSPHLFSISERMRVNGVAASDEWIAAITDRLADAITGLDATFFEATTAMAFACFAEQEVDAAVVEVGMGGRLDATNVVNPAVSVITNIGFDHTEYLGTTLAEIASEKAGIIKEDVPVVCGCCPPEAREVIEVAAREKRSDVINACGNAAAQLEGVRLDLGGAHQVRNAGVAIKSVETFRRVHPEIDWDRSGLSQTRFLSGLRGRCEVLAKSPAVVVDVAHNVDGIRATLAFMEEQGFLSGRLHVLLGIAGDKDVDGVLDALAEKKAALMVADLESNRLVRPANLAATARAKGLRIVEIARPAEAVRHFRETSAPSDSLLATGSHFMVGALPREMFERAPTG